MKKAADVLWPWPKKQTVYRMQSVAGMIAHVHYVQIILGGLCALLICLLVVLKDSLIVIWFWLNLALNFFLHPQAGDKHWDCTLQCKPISISYFYDYCGFLQRILGAVVWQECCVFVGELDIIQFLSSVQEVILDQFSSVGLMCLLVSTLGLIMDTIMSKLVNAWKKTVPLKSYMLSISKNELQDIPPNAHLQYEKLYVFYFKTIVHRLSKPIEKLKATLSIRL